MPVPHGGLDHRNFGGLFAQEGFTDGRKGRNWLKWLAFVKVQLISANHFEDYRFPVIQVLSAADTAKADQVLGKDTGIHHFEPRGPAAQMVYLSIYCPLAFPGGFVFGILRKIAKFSGNGNRFDRLRALVVHQMADAALDLVHSFLGDEEAQVHPLNLSSF